MTPLAPLVFIDTSVLVYAHDAGEPAKRDAARALVLDHLGEGTLRTSTQVLAEYFSAVTGKGETPLDASAAAGLIEQLPAEAVVSPGLATVRAAARRSAAARISIWDALIWEAARAAGAAVLYTEDARLLRAVNGGEEAVAGLEAVDPFGGTASTT